MARPELRRRFLRLTPALADAYLARLNEIATTVHRPPEVFRYARDPDDEPYLNLAIAVEAQYLVSRDRDLLDLATASSPEGRLLRELAPRLAIMDPESFLEDLVLRFVSGPP